jgi:hypothetical protein
MVKQEATTTINNDVLLALIASIQGLTLALNGKNVVLLCRTLKTDTPH